MPVSDRTFELARSDQACSGVVPAAALAARQAIRSHCRCATRQTTGWKMTDRAVPSPSLQGEVAAGIARQDTIVWLTLASKAQQRTRQKHSLHPGGGSFMLLPNVGFESLNEVFFGAGGVQLSPCQFFSCDVITRTLLGRGAPTQFPA